MDQQPDNKRFKKEARLPVTLLCGFLGAGKTTLLRHILETKNKKGAFKCAVIVNDMAELNIDKNLIESSSIVKSDNVIAMQNGCVCCSLQDDLVEQIKVLAKQGTFDYMIIEASGVSEPSAIAKLFEECKDDHDHDEEHKDVALSELARLDTCVTVVDSSNFFFNLDNVVKPENTNQIGPLLAEQIEFANVIVLNKTDLVNADQLDQVNAKIAMLNPSATILTAKNSSIDVKDVINTSKFDQEQLKGLSTELFNDADKDCCKESVARGESPCCRRARTHKTDLSEVMLSPKNMRTTRHQARFNLTSFIFKARRPFSTQRLHENFIQKFFVFCDRQANEQPGDEEQEGDEADETKEEDEEEKKRQEKEKKEYEEDYLEQIKQLQQEAVEKQAVRTEAVGNLVRFKGFMWMPNSHDVQGNVSQAGNAITIEPHEVWNAVSPKAWTGTEEEKAEIRTNWIAPYGDRRQELVFIGQDLKHDVIQKILDECLMTDEEFAMGVDGWKATMGDMFLDSFQEGGQGDEHEHEHEHDEHCEHEHEHEHE